MRLVDLTKRHQMIKLDACLVEAEQLLMRTCKIAFALSISMSWKETLLQLYLWMRKLAHKHATIWHGKAPFRELSPNAGDVNSMECSTQMHTIHTNAFAIQEMNSTQFSSQLETFALKKLMPSKSQIIPSCLSN